MNRIFRKIKINLIAWVSIELARRWPSHRNISVMRKSHNIQLSTNQLKDVSTAIKRNLQCNLLIFGLGNDSVFWSKLNRGGVTVFIEDNLDWFQAVTKRSKDLMAYLVNYNTQRKDWRLLLESPSLLNMILPKDLEKIEWDVILVDGPEGWNDQSPGRMKSIFLASKLVKKSVDIFAHDCDRKVEDIYCSTFLKKENLIAEIAGSHGLMRHYHISSRSI